MIRQKDYEVLNDEEIKLIAQDAAIAIDSLNAIYTIANSGNLLHTTYLIEKIEKAQRCLDFIKSCIREVNA